MATYPGVQDRLAAELDGAGLLATPSLLEPRDVDLNVLHELPVLDAVSLFCPQHPGEHAASGVLSNENVF